MAFLQFKNVNIAGIAAGVPDTIASNLHPTADDVVSSDYAPEDFVKTTGVLERHVSFKLTTSDLCYAAAVRLIDDLGWDKNEIEAIIFVSQSPDYILPATACILQDRLGLSKDCYTMDIALGCSGWIYGLSTTASLLGNGTIKKALLLCGDAKKDMMDLVIRYLDVRELLLHWSMMRQLLISTSILEQMVAALMQL